MSAIEHNPEFRVSDNTTTLWAVCPCGWESAFFTIEGDGKKAMEGAKKEIDDHLAPRPTENPEDQPLEEPPLAFEEDRG